MHASAAPDALKATESADGSVRPSDPIVWIPPTSKKLLAKVARAVKSAGVPRLARKTFGRAPFVFRISSERSRKRSKGAASRIGDNASKVMAASLEGASATGLAARTAT